MIPLTQAPAPQLVAVRGLQTPAAAARMAASL